MRKVLRWSGGRVLGVLSQHLLDQGGVVYRGRRDGSALLLVLVLLLLLLLELLERRCRLLLLIPLLLGKHRNLRLCELMTVRQT